MDFDDTPEEAAFRAEARAWLEANAIPKGSPEDFSAGYFTGDIDPAEYIKRCRWWQGQLHEAGWAGITWPKAVRRPGRQVHRGGDLRRGAGQVGRLGRRLRRRPSAWSAPTLMQHGTPEQQARWLDPMLRGEEVWCQLFSEPEAGSDLASLRTRAVRDGDEWVVDGQKVWTSNAHVRRVGHPHRPLRPRCDRSTRASRTSPSTCARPASRSGRCASSTARPTSTRCSSTGVRIPADQVVGEVDKGWKVAVTTLSNERVAIAGGSGMSDPRAPAPAGAEQLGVRDDPLFRQRFARVHTRNEILRYLKLRTRTAMSRGERPGPRRRS